ncbi:hypothetical protein [Phenylobacterium sp.]|uniref:hypothetical protein n=1 Tax=Phenylobacterium sp. TaxID=1871053 RepID=UPI0025CD864A|nr:hypothetical protein [Phenylobacterium sp.]
MRNLIAPAVLALSLVAGSAAFAATPAPSAPAKSTMAAAKPSPAAKKAECEKSWASQKTHTGDKAAFVKACVAKG